MPTLEFDYHSGDGGALTAFYSYLPEILVVPFAHDQPDNNALRAKRLGVARLVYPRRYSARRAAEQLRALLQEPGCRDRAGEVAKQTRSEDGVGAACEAIEELLARSGGSP